MLNVLFVSFALSVASGALGQGFFPGQGSSSDDYDPVTIPLSDLDDSGCPVTTGTGGVRILCLGYRFQTSSPIMPYWHDTFYDASILRDCTIIGQAFMFAWGVAHARQTQLWNWSWWGAA